MGIAGLAGGMMDPELRVRNVGTAGFEPAAYRFLQLHWEIIHASVSSNV
jgi:hypothetical protein